MPKGLTKRRITCPHCGKEGKPGGLNYHIKAVHESDISSQFWAKVEKGDGCWLWTGARHYRGYGACGKRYGDCRAHRVAYKLAKGAIPEGLGVLHRCNNPLCVNPDHLYLGDQKQNMADAVASGRKHHGRWPVDDLLHPQLSKRLTGRQW